MSHVRFHARLVVAVALLVSGVALPSRASPVSGYLAARAEGRAEGNDRAQAIALGERLLGTVWPAQVLKIRVDSAGGHRVAGLVVSGTRFHGRLDEAAFLREVRSLVAAAFANAQVEEVDLWTTVPVDAGFGAMVSGDRARPTSRNVFAVTVERSELPHLDALLRSPDVYWDRAWRAALRQGTAP